MIHNMLRGRNQNRIFRPKFRPKVKRPIRTQWDTQILLNVRKKFGHFDLRFRGQNFVQTQRENLADESVEGPSASSANLN